MNESAPEESSEWSEGVLVMTKQASQVESSGKLRGKTVALQVLKLIRDTVRPKTALGTIRDWEDSDPFRILISTILSARTRDPVTEKASERLFSKFSRIEDLSHARQESVAKLIRPVAFYNQKAKCIIDASRMLLEKFDGSVPETYDELLELPGVGRKTAGCVLVYGFGIPAIPVDVHVHRISNRIGLVATKTAEETERALSDLYDKNHWLDLNELLVSFGQTVCRPIGPKCKTCSVNSLCNYFNSQRLC